MLTVGKNPEHRRKQIGRQINRIIMIKLPPSHGPENYIFFII